MGPTWSMVHLVRRNYFAFYSLVVKCNSFLSRLTFIHEQIFYHKLVLIPSQLQILLVKNFSSPLGAFSIEIKEVIDFLVINLEKRNKELELAPKVFFYFSFLFIKFFDCSHSNSYIFFISYNWWHSFHLPIYCILLSQSVFIAFHCISFSRPCLTINKNGAIIPLYYLVT